MVSNIGYIYMPSKLVPCNLRAVFKRWTGLYTGVILFGVSLSEPHTSGTACACACVCLSVG